MVKNVGTGLNNSFIAVFIRDSFGDSLLTILSLLFVRASTVTAADLKWVFDPYPSFHPEIMKVLTRKLSQAIKCLL